MPKKSDEQIISMQPDELLQDMLSYRETDAILLLKKKNYKFLDSMLLDWICEHLFLFCALAPVQTA